jgi:hypothetical protein
MLLNADKLKSPVNRRSFMKNAGATTAAVAALGIFTPKNLFAASSEPTASPDTPGEIFTAALVAEDLASTFYYNALIGDVIQDINLAGPGGTATKVASGGSVSNVFYIRAALSEEIVHANLFRSLLGISSVSKDPYQTFYLPASAFAELGPFINVLEALEDAFIGAYLAAVQEFALLASGGKPLTYGGVTYQPADFAYFAKIAASILGVEAEHRALGRAISPNILPANQLNYEQRSTVGSVYNGPISAVKALTPFLGPGSGLTAYSLSDAIAGAPNVSTPTVGNPPTSSLLPLT